MHSKYDKYILEIFGILEFVTFIIGWRKVSGIWDYLTADIQHSFKMIPEMYQLSNPFDFSVSISGLHTSYLFAIGYCAILIIQYVVLLYIMNQFTMCLKDYFHLRKTTLEKHFQRMPFSFWLLSGTVIGLQILNSVLAQHVRLFKPDFLIEVIVVWFLAIAFHYVASIIVNINKFVDN